MKRLFVVSLVVPSVLVGPSWGRASTPAPQAADESNSEPDATRMSPEAELIAAYQKELVYLVEERRALKERQEAARISLEEQLKEAKADITRLTAEVLSTQGLADKAERVLSDLERQAESATDSLDLVDETVTRARKAMGLPELSEVSPGDKVRGFSEAFVAAGARLLRAGQLVKSSDAEFFDRDGVLNAGTIWRLGEVAAWGVSDTAKGALMPAGNGKLRLAAENTAQSAVRVASGNSTVSSLDIFLFESLDKAVQQKAEKSWADVVRAGGVIGWVIVALGLVALLMVVARALILLRASSRTESLTSVVVDLVRSAKGAEALDTCNRTKGAAARVLRATLMGLHRDRAELEDIVSEAVLHETPRLERFGAIIMVAAAVAPLLGLLGTVSGMISTFDIITEFGTGDPRMLSGGISEALITTELGLIVAIPALLLGTLLNGRADAIASVMERSALQVMNAQIEGADGAPRPGGSRIDGESPVDFSADLVAHAVSVEALRQVG